MLGGVAGGLAEYFAIDAALVRLVAVILGVTGPGVPIYIVMWIVVPEAPRDLGPQSSTGSRMSGEDTRLMVGTALVLLGAWILAQRWLPWLDEILWPSVLIVFGIGILIYGARR